MKLAAWRATKAGCTQGWLALQLGCSQSYVSQIERSRNPLIPGADIMRRIYILTDRAVQPNDFHDIPAWEAERIKTAAEAEMREQAA